MLLRYLNSAAIVLFLVPGLAWAANNWRTAIENMRTDYRTLYNHVRDSREQDSTLWQAQGCSYQTDPERCQYQDYNEAIGSISVLPMVSAHTTINSDLIEDYHYKVMTAAHINDSMYPVRHWRGNLIEEGYSLGPSDIGHGDEYTSMLAGHAQLFGASAFRLYWGVRTIWNMNDNMHLRGNGISQNWARYNPQLDAFLFYFCKGNSQGMTAKTGGYPNGTIWEHEGSGTFWMTSPASSLMLWYYGPNHYFYNQDGQGGAGSLLMGRMEVWANAIRTEYGTGQYAKRAYEIPGNVRFDGTPYWNETDWNDYDAPSWAYAACQSWSSRGRHEGGWTKFKQELVYQVAFNQPDMPTNPRLRAIREDFDRGMAIAYCARNSASGSPERQAPVTSYTYNDDELWATYRIIREDKGPILHPISGLDCDENFLTNGDPWADEQRRGLAAAIYAVRGDEANAAAQAKLFVQDLETDISQKITQYVNSEDADGNGNPELVKIEGADTMLAVLRCGGGARERGVDVARYALRPRTWGLNVLCMKTSPEESIYRIGNTNTGSGTSALPITKRWGYVGEVDFIIGSDADYDGEWDETPTTYTVNMRHHDTYELPVPVNSYSRLIIRNKSTTLQDNSTLPNLHVDDYYVSNIGHFSTYKTGIYRTTQTRKFIVFVQNTGMVETGPVNVELRNSADEKIGETKVVNIKGWRGMDMAPGQQLIWELPQDADVEEVVVDPDNLVVEINEHDNRAQMRP